MTLDADVLIGKQLNNGWVINKHKPTYENATGGCHSLCFIANRDDGDEEAFVKMLDTSIISDHEEPLADLKLRLDVFEYERNIVKKCQGHHMSGFVRASHGGKSWTPIN